VGVLGGIFRNCAPKNSGLYFNVQCEKFSEKRGLVILLSALILKVGLASKYCTWSVVYQEIFFRSKNIARGRRPSAIFLLRKNISCVYHKTKCYICIITFQLKNLEN
jgi:hypothetical protein